MTLPRRTLALGFGLALVCPAVGFAASDEIESLAKRLIELRSEVESIHDDVENRQQEHRNRMATLSQRRAELEAQIQRQELELQKIQRAKKEVEAASTKADAAAQAIVPVAEASLRTLEEHVQASLPFTVEDRLAELTKLRRDLAAGDITPPRALNKLWSFVEDELRLSKENGLFRQTIVLDGEEQLADVVRVGMVMLFYRSGSGGYGYAERGPDGWVYTPVDAQGAEQLRGLFDDFERQVRSGYYQIPNAIPEARR